MTKNEIIADESSFQRVCDAYVRRHIGPCVSSLVSRYYLSTLVEGQSDGLCLCGSEPTWNIYGPCYRRVLYWLENYDETRP